MQFMKSSLDSLVKNLMDKDFKYLSEKYSVEFLKLVKEKGVCIRTILKSVLKINYLIGVSLLVL